VSGLASKPWTVFAGLASKPVVTISHRFAPQNRWRRFVSDLTLKLVVTVSGGLSSKPAATVFPGLALKLVVTVFSSLVSKLVATVSPGLTSKLAVDFLVELQIKVVEGFPVWASKPTASVW
jgi:hypothetical protein